MSVDGTERMISVAELLRREGVVPADERSVKGRVIATAAGVMALCGASVTGMLALAPNLSTAFLPSGIDDGVSQAAPGVHAGSVVSGQSASGTFERTGANQSTGVNPLTGTFTGDLGYRAANHQVPAMSLLGSDAPAAPAPGAPSPRSDATEDAGEPSEGDAGDSVGSTSRPQEPEESTTEPDESKPAPSDKPPAESDEPPAESEEPPAESEEPPSQTEEPPAEGETSQPPAEDETPSEEPSSEQKKSGSSEG